RRRRGAEADVRVQTGQRVEDRRLAGAGKPGDAHPHLPYSYAFFVSSKPRTCARQIATTDFASMISSSATMRTTVATGSGRLSEITSSASSFCVAGVKLRARKRWMRSVV